MNNFLMRSKKASDVSETLLVALGVELDLFDVVGGKHSK
jgi:hypothetical protein